MAGNQTLTDMDWQVRLDIYRFFVAFGRPPTVQDMASQFTYGEEEARESYRRLHQGHHIYLIPGTGQIRMANPLSGVPTPYRTIVNGRPFWANCAWDALGIAAMLGADARIEARHPISGEVIHMAVGDDQLEASEEVMTCVVHFSLPVRQWYDDLVHT